MRVVLTAEARQELREATQWYAVRSSRAAQRFVAAYKNARQLIQDGPEQWAEIEPGVRRVLLRKFPYSLLYAVEDDKLVVLVVKHHKRHPDYWRER
ncbi:MAG TPA: type II toxin-antitoxin system RelE/ParE family toxin [Enhygromyxa sp.]|nr:type II toxin-antitoxin system RelE/ParE family toxin [Enhygromyxa sp.]